MFFFSSGESVSKRVRSFWAILLVWLRGIIYKQQLRKLISLRLLGVTVIRVSSSIAITQFSNRVFAFIRHVSPLCDWMDWKLHKACILTFSLSGSMPNSISWVNKSRVSWSSCHCSSERDYNKYCRHTIWYLVAIGFPST